MKQLELFDEFEDFLVREPAPEIDYIKSREAIFDKLNCHTKVIRTTMNKKRVILIAAIIAALAAYPVYAISHSFFMEFRSSNEGISVKYQSETEEFGNIREEMANEDKYLNEKYKEVIEERSNALEPGAAEVIIVRSPGGFNKKFFIHTIEKREYIEEFDLFKNKLKDESGFESLKPVFELPGSFWFSKGELRYRRNFYVPDDEKEALMIDAERNGKSYAVKPINRLDEIDAVYLIYKNRKDEDSTLSIGVEYDSRDTYILPEESESSIERLIYNGDEILTYKLHDLNGSLVRKVYSMLANNLFFTFSFSKNIENHDAVEIIDAFLSV